jgi:xylulokinase
LEGITFNIRLMCEAMEKQAGEPFSELRMIGGGSKSALWRDIEASILNKNIVTLSAHQEANVLGASIIAGVALGIFDSFADGVQQYVKRSETIEPKEEWRRVYEQQFPIFNRAYAALCQVNDELTQLSNRGDD